jgi:hypothetical protein
VGGAAVQSQVLKSITAKHLALAGQSLECVRAILPSLRQTVEEALLKQQKILAAEFDKVSKVCANFHFFPANRSKRNALFFEGL